MILYLICGHRLVAIPTGKNQDRGAFVDDTFFMAIGDEFQECDRILNDLLDKQDEWSKTHNSKVEMSKSQCLRLTREKNIAREDFKRRGTDTIIKCIASAKLLGVQMDEELR
jgi:hypothetical protein